jgi:phage gp36-like protein
MACLVLVLVLAGTGTVAAASGSVPGDNLYSVKMAAEQVQWKLTFSQKAKARLQARFAERRVQEMAQLARKGRTEELEKLTSRFGAHLAKIEQLAAQIRATDSEDGERITELRQVLYVNMARDLAIIEVAEARAPVRARAAIAVARAKLMERYSEAIKALEELQGGQVGLTRAAGESGTRYQLRTPGRGDDLHLGII